MFDFDLLILSRVTVVRSEMRLEKVREHRRGTFAVESRYRATVSEE
jgi:hypothetical protein